MNYHVKYSNEANEGLDRHCMDGNWKLVDKIWRMVDQLATDLYNGIGNPEKLRYEMGNVWSRRINKKHRLIYNIKENKKILIASVWGYYRDKYIHTY